MGRFGQRDQLWYVDGLTVYVPEPLRLANAPDRLALACRHCVEADIVDVAEANHANGSIASTIARFEWVFALHGTLLFRTGAVPGCSNAFDAHTNMLFRTGDS